ncbi:MAG: LysM peptidoglycan-binding domain-containing protein [Dysgonamonadaceae bacterium]|jgi:LysM repeat protein|nr:LysM peptidoglycan-binding domain-containing protein [Dysgonamonadaceae bacterium]
MLQRIFFVSLILIIQVYNVKSEEAFYPDASFFTQDTDFFLHTVERGETVYSIAGMYHVSIDDIYRLNPGSKEGIKTGSNLKIPQESGSYFYHTIRAKETLYSVSRHYQMKGEDIMAVNPGLSVETFTIGKIIRIPTNKVTSPSKETNEALDRMNTEALLNQSVTGNNIEKIKVALLLPFGTKEGTAPANASKNRIVEYYEGFLLALNELKKKNISVQLQVYDTGTKTETIKAILKTNDMQNIHLLIGGLSEEQIQLLSDFASKLEIPYVIPFTSTSNEPLNNYNVYQVNTPQSLLYSKTSFAFSNKFKNANILFYDSGSSANKADLIRVMKADLTAKKIPYKTIPAGNNLSAAFTGAIDSQKDNVVVPSDDSKLTLVKLIEVLKIIKENRPETSISMFGHPAWQTYAAEFSSDFFRLNAHIYTIFFADPSSASVKSFINKYHRWYSRDLINVFPKYGMLGYDTGMFFIQLLSQYGTSHGININNLKYNGIQTDFHFDRINNWGGFINANIYFVEFGKDFKINIKRIE